MILLWTIHCRMIFSWKNVFHSNFSSPNFTNSLKCLSYSSDGHYLFTIQSHFFIKYPVSLRNTSHYQRKWVANVVSCWFLEKFLEKALSHFSLKIGCCTSYISKRFLVLKKCFVLFFKQNFLPNHRLFPPPLTHTLSISHLIGILHTLCLSY